MILDNFDIIETLLRYDNNTGDPLIYHIDLIERKKDGVKTSGTQNSARRITSFYPENMEQWNKFKNRIIDLCNARPGLRAYINLSPKRASSIMKQMLTDLSTRFQYNAYTGLNKFFPSAIATTKPEKGYALWFLDIDKEDFEDKNGNFNNGAMLDFINEFHKKFPGCGLMLIPSKSGYHFITKPFNRYEFNDWMKDNHKADGWVKVNSLTNLYMNTGEDNIL